MEPRSSALSSAGAAMIMNRCVSIDYYLDLVVMLAQLDD